MQKNIFIKVTLTLCIAFLLNGCTTNSQSIKTISDRTISKKSVDAFIESYMQAKNIPGISYAIINDGKVAHHNVMGYAFREKEVKVNKETIFEGCSISKSVFGFFVMTFVEDGTLDLDKPVHEYMPIPDLDIANDQRYKKITARMLLSHTAGFPNERENQKDGKLKILFDPGTKHQYSGEGYRYLGNVLMHILHIDHAGFEDEFQKRVAQPLKMTHTVFIQNEYTRKRKAEPYVPEGRVDWKNNYYNKKDDGIVSGASSIHSEALDFSKWMIGMMNSNVLTKKSYDELLKIQSSTGEGLLDSNYTLGFFAQDTPLGRLYGHGGNSIGFTSWFAFHKGKKWGVVLFSNSEFGQELGIKLTLFLTTGMQFGWYYLVIGVFSITLILVLIYAIQHFFFRKKVKNKLQKMNFKVAALILSSLVGIIIMLLFTQIPQSIYGRQFIITGILLLVVASIIMLFKLFKEFKAQWKSNDLSLSKKMIYSIQQLNFLMFIVLLIHFVFVGFSM